MKPPEELQVPAAPGAVRERAFELDALRGLAILMMMLHHMIFDLRFMLGLDVFAFQESAWFQFLLRPLFVAVFLVVSGICCSFSRNNARRGVRMLAAAGILTAATVAGTLLFKTQMSIYFNVIHLITVGTLLYAALESRDKKARTKGKREFRLAFAILASAVLLFLGSVLGEFRSISSDWLLPIGLPSVKTANLMADYMPLIPWLGLFFTGAAIGLVLYSGRATLFPGAPRRLVQTLRPFGFLGRHALAFYLLHQPILLGLLLLLRNTGVI